MIKSLAIICPKCNKTNVYNTNKENLMDVEVDWLRCWSCNEISDKADWTQYKI